MAISDEERRARNREATRRYRETHREQRREENRQARLKNPEKLREQSRRSYWKHRDEIRTRRSPAERFARKLKYDHGMSLSVWQAMWQAQDGRCYLCGDKLTDKNRRGAHIDHDHDCCPYGKSCGNCRRGLACHQCNVLIGMAGDDPDRLMRIAVNFRERKEVMPSCQVTYKSAAEISELLPGPRQSSLF